MVKYTAAEKLNVLFTLIKSSPFFLTCFIIGLFVISFVVLDFKTTKKVRNKLMLVCLVGTIGFIIYKYYKYLLSISDNLVEEIFMALYFPNLAVYSIIILITNICLFINLLKKNLKNEFKIANILSCTLIDFLFILILEVIIENKIDVYETLTVYSNKQLLILLELSTLVFLVWLLVVIFMKLVYITIKKEKVEEKIKQNILYEAPSFNKYVYNETKKVMPEMANDYTNVFEVKEEVEIPKQSLEIPAVVRVDNSTTIIENKEIVEKEPVIEIKPIKTELLTTPSLDPVIEANSLEIPVVLEVKPEEPVKEKREKIKFTSLFAKKEVTKEEESYRIPLFDTLNDDAIMNCIVPVQKERIIPRKSETAISIEKQERINNNLDSDQSNLLKDYLLRQG